MRNQHAKCLTQGATSVRKYEFVIHIWNSESMLSGALWIYASVEWSETIINSTYYRFLCLISFHTACVNSYTFLAAQIQVIIFDS